MGTKAHTILITLVYVGLAICITGLLATALIDNFPHQVFGIAFFILFMGHLLLNRFWIRHSLIGRWDLQRVFLMIVDAALVLLSIAQIINCILLSSFFWSMLPQQFAYFSSSLHMCVGTWIFVIAAVHFGLNANTLIGNKLHFDRAGNGKIYRNKNNALLLLVWLVLAGIGVYGIFEFFQLQMTHYMFMVENAEVEINVPIVTRFFQYLCIGGAFVEIAHWLSVLVQRYKRKGSTALKDKA